MPQISATPPISGDAALPVPCTHDAERSQGLRAICATRGLGPFVPRAVSLVHDSFEVVGAVRLTMDENAETGEQWIEIGVTVQGEPAEVLAAYDRYTDRWLESVPAAVRGSFRLAWRLT